MKNKKRKYEDYVLGLITGRFETAKVITIDGPKILRSFKPFRLNPNPPLAKVKFEREGAFTEDQIMVFEGLRHRRIKLDKSILAKSKEEKWALKEAKKQHKSTLVKAGINPKLQLNISELQILK